MSHDGHQTDNDLLPVPFGLRVWLFDNAPAEGVIMSVVPVQSFQKIRDKIPLAYRDRLQPQRAPGRDQAAFGDRMVGGGEEALEPHLLKTLHDLFKPFAVQKGRAFNPGNAFQNLAIRFIVQMEILFCNVKKSLFLPTDGLHRVMFIILYRGASVAPSALIVHFLKSISF